MSSARPPIPEAELAAAVIQRAIDDAMTPDERLARMRTLPSKDGPRRVYTTGLKPRERDEAVRFLIDPAAGWSSSRAAWCDAADVDPDVVRREALRRIPDSSIPTDLRRSLGRTATIAAPMAAVQLEEAA